MPETCEACGGALGPHGVCEACGAHTRIGARDRIALLTDRFSERDANVVGGDPLSFPGYADAVGRAKERSGEQEAVVCGVSDVGGVRCVLVVFEFSFLGGSMGIAVGEKVAAAFDMARDARLPVVAVASTGGARMQEGMVSLVQMAKTVEARRRHMADGLAQVSVLASPTTGGVYASFASLADVVLAEPGATVGFAGPRVVTELTGAEPPPDVHTSEFAHAHGHVDAIVARPDLRDHVASALRSLTATPARPTRLRARIPVLDEVADGPPAWERVRIARDPGRPKADAVLDALLVDETPLGTGPDTGMLVRLGALAPTGTRVVALAQDASGTGRILPAGFRLAMRAIELAGRLGLPLVSVIDTRGADPLPDSEADGVAQAIARTFLATLGCPTPTLAVVTGEGGSGGALATAPCDRVLAWEHAFFSVIAPEGAASILHRDGSRAPELAEQLGITTPHLLRLGIADGVVGEPDGGAQTDPERALTELGEAVASQVDELCALPNAPRITHRRRRWRRAGSDWIRLG